MQNLSARFQVKLDLSAYEVPTPSLFDFAPEVAETDTPDEPYRDSEGYEDTVKRLKRPLATTIPAPLFRKFDDVASEDRRKAPNALRWLMILAVENNTLDLKRRTASETISPNKHGKRVTCTAYVAVDLIEAFTALCEKSDRTPAGGLRWLVLQAVEHNTVNLGERTKGLSDKW